MEAIALILLFLFGRRKPTVAIESGPGKIVPVPGGVDPWTARTASLMTRARSGARWAPKMATRLGSDAAGAAAGRWIGIESGGNPLASSSLNERGLVQVSKDEAETINKATAVSFSPAEFDALASTKTTEDQHADLAAKVIAGELALIDVGGITEATALGWGQNIGNDGRTIRLSSGTQIVLGIAAAALGIGAAKLRHALPLLVKEMRDQKMFAPNLTLTIGNMVGTNGPGFKPSDRLKSFVKTREHAVTGDPTRDLILRFFAPVAVVCFAEDAIKLAPAFIGSNKVA